MGWSNEEDVYNPEHFKIMLQGWLKHRRELAAT